MRAPRAATCLCPACSAKSSRCASASSRCSRGTWCRTPTMVSIIELLNRPLRATTPVAAATAGTTLPSRFCPGFSARARLTTRSAAAMGTSARCSSNRATDRYPEQIHHPAHLDLHEEGAEFGFGRTHTRQQLTDTAGESDRIGLLHSAAVHNPTIPSHEHMFITRSGNSRSHECPCTATLTRLGEAVSSNPGQGVKHRRDRDRRSTRCSRRTRRAPS
jgi:hypothetical protein